MVLAPAALAHSGRAKIVGTTLFSRGLSKKSIDFEGLGAVDQLPYALVIPRGQESTSAKAEAHADNPIQQFNENMTLTPDAIVQNPAKMEDYLQLAVDLLNQ